MTAGRRVPAFTAFESSRRTLMEPALGAAISVAVHAAGVAGIVLASALPPAYTPEEQLRAAQFLLPLRQEAPRPLQERVSFIGLSGLPAAPPAAKPTFTDRFVEKPADVQAPVANPVDAAPEPPQRAYSELEVDSTALRDPDSEGPVYPADLLERGVEGRALVRFVVTADGSVDLGTFMVILSTDTLFTKAARDVLPRMKFRPAWFSGKPVSQLVEQEFTFRIRKPTA